MSYFVFPILLLSFSRLISSVGEESLLSITGNCVVSVRRGFLFLLELRIGCFISL